MFTNEIQDGRVALLTLERKDLSYVGPSLTTGMYID